MSEDKIPTRSQKASQVEESDETKSASKKKATATLAGKYRVREGYKVAHGALNNENRHNLAAEGEIIELTHDEALSIIRLTTNQKTADGRPNGPAIETEESYNARVEQEKKHAEFMEMLQQSNSDNALL